PSLAVAQVGAHVAAVPWGACSLPPLAGGRSEGSTASLHDRGQARRRGEQLLHHGGALVPGAGGVFRAHQELDGVGRLAGGRAHYGRADARVLEPQWQLQRHIATMPDAGLEEMGLSSLRGEGDGRLWRSVPGRRWYADQRGTTAGSQEVVLFHKLSKQPSSAPKFASSRVSERSPSA